MRHSIVAVLATLLAATASAAPSIAFFAPVRYHVGTAEHFMSIDGSGFLPIEGTTVIFGGGAGTFELLPNAWSDRRIDVWVPPEIGRRVGLYTVRVRTKHNGITEESNSLQFEVYGQSGPALELPQSNIIKQATSKAGANVTFTVSAQSSGDGSQLAVTCDHHSGDLYPFGSTIVRCSTTDTSGATTEGSFGILVVDFVAPKIHVPEDILATATGPNGANVSYTATADDDIDGPLPVNCMPASGSLFPANKTTTVRCDAVDAHFNSARAEFHITVGTPPPSGLNVPPPITAEATGPGGAVVTFTVSAGPSMAVNCYPASGSLFPLGTTIVNCNAAEMFGTFTITVTDTTPPAVTSISITPNVLSPPNHKLVPATVAVTSSDAVDPAPASMIWRVTANEPIDPSDWRITGALTLELRAERSGSADERIYLVEVRTIDGSGNSTVNMVTVRVPHDNKGDAAATPPPALPRRRSSGH
jgi:hypothetical protein